MYWLDWRTFLVRGCRLLNMRSQSVKIQFVVYVGVKFREALVKIWIGSFFCFPRKPKPPNVACGTLYQSSCVILTSPTDCSDDSWRDTFFGKHEHAALWLLICCDTEKRLLTYCIFLFFYCLCILLATIRCEIKIIINHKFNNRPTYVKRTQS